MTIVSRETEDQLTAYAALIRKWNPRINLVAPASLEHLETRHIADSVQLAELGQAQPGNWLDLGSGGGLPGIVLAIFRPSFPVFLLESDQRKATFLRTVARELGLKNVAVYAQRIERQDPLAATNVSARALAPLPRLMAYVERHLESSGTAWLMKGRNWRAEVEEAKIHWQFELTAHPSRTDSDAAILEITRIRHV